MSWFCKMRVGFASCELFLRVGFASCEMGFIELPVRFCDLVL